MKKLFYFNSIKVRLEPLIAEADKRKLEYFNSIKVRLELNVLREPFCR